jgi:hypothetical protein
MGITMNKQHGTDGMDYAIDIGKHKKRKEVDKVGKNKLIEVTNINDMKLHAILWHVVKRHKMLLMTTYATVITTLYIVNGLPIAVHNLFGR